MGLVLGAGGAVGGAFHVGVIAALQEAAGWDARAADLIVGTSAGSIVGALLRAGLSPRDYAAWRLGEPISMEAARLLKRGGTDPIRHRPDRSMSAFPWRPSAPMALLRAARRPWSIRLGTIAAAALPEGSASSDSLVNWIRPFFETAWPEQPLWICTLRLDDGERVVLGREGACQASVAEAVGASCAIPGWFTPVLIQGVRHVDGGAYSLTNLDTVADLHLDAVIVSSPMSAVSRATRSPVDAALRALAHRQLRAESARVRARGTMVIAIEPSADDLRVMGDVADAMDRTRRSTVTRHIRQTLPERLRRAGVVELLAGRRSPLPQERGRSGGERDPGSAF